MMLHIASCTLLNAKVLFFCRITKFRCPKDSIKWLYNASELKLNPQIPRKLSDTDNTSITDWQLATFQTNYDPYKNPWMV
ncbi:MAG: hypothetical protein SNH27_08855 [Rikenellaceae bacterium]